MGSDTFLLLATTAKTTRTLNKRAVITMGAIKVAMEEDMEETAETADTLLAPHRVSLHLHTFSDWVLMSV